MLSTVTQLFSPQGVIQVGERNATTGVVTKYMDLGNAPELSVSLSTETEEVKESTTGERLPLARLDKAKSAEISVSLHSFDAKTLAILMRSTVEDVASGTVSSETLPSALVADDIVKLAHPFVSSVVVTDSAGSTATVSTSDYQVDAEGGLIRLVDVSGYTQPFKVAYSYAAAENAAMFTGAKKSYELVFSGVNTARSNEPLRVELYKVEFDPAANLPFITNEVGVFELKGSLLIDDTKDASDDTFGQFGRVIRKAA